MKLPPISKKTRHVVYKNCLIKVTDFLPLAWCICPILAHTIKNTLYSSVEEAFPDFWKYKPVNKDGYNPWFTIERRIEVLKELIKATE